MSSEILADADHKMARAVDAMERDFQGFRTGRASTALVERITVDYYGTQTPLNQLAGISVPEECERQLAGGVASFAGSLDSLFQLLGERRAALLPQ